MKNQWKLLLSILILIVVVIFALQNTNVVGIDLFFAKFQVPLVLIILLSLLLGVIVGLIASFSAISGHKKDKATALKELNSVKEVNLRDAIEKDKEISHLRNQIKELKNKNNNTLNVEGSEFSE